MSAGRHTDGAPVDTVGMTSRLIVLTDRAQLRLGRGLVRTVRECVDAGLERVVVREHDLAPGSRHALVAELAAIDGLTVISSRIPDPAAHGLHLAAHQPCNAQLPVPSTRHNGAPDPATARYMHLGRSCHSPDEVHRAAAEGVDYVTLSPFAATQSKPGYGPPVPREDYAQEYAVPVLALGGITAANAGDAIAAGADGVAVMGEVMRAADPADAVAALLEAVSR